MNHHKIIWRLYIDGRNAWTINFTDITIDEIVPDIELSYELNGKNRADFFVFGFALVMK